jgi:hypothetical protein
MAKDQASYERLRRDLRQRYEASGMPLGEARPEGHLSAGDVGTLQQIASVIHQFGIEHDLNDVETLNDFANFVGYLSWTLPQPQRSAPILAALLAMLTAKHVGSPELVH